MWCPARIIAIINNGNDIKHLILDSFVSCFFRFGCGDAFCTDRFLQTDGVTHRRLYTEQLLRADILTQRVLCTKKICTQTPLHGGFLRKEGNALYKDVFFAHINQGTQAFLHTEPFPQRSLCTEQFSHMFFYTKKPLTQRNLYTQIAHRSFYRPIFFCTHKFYPELFLPSIFFCTENLYAQKIIYTAVFTDRRFLHKKFSAQKSYAQKVLRTAYRRFYTQMSLHGHKLHRNLCTQHAFTHSQLLHREALLRVFLITYLSCSPLKWVFLLANAENHSKKSLTSIQVSSTLAEISCGS